MLIINETLFSIAFALPSFIVMNKKIEKIH